MAEPDRDKPFERNYSDLWTLPPPAKAGLPHAVVAALIAIAVVFVWAMAMGLAAPLVRLVRDSAVALFA
jgi:hypothetical protein